MGERSRRGSVPQEPRVRTIAVNRRAHHDYDILETYEAGLALTGTEIKSIRQGKVDLRDAYAYPLKGELWLYNLHIAPYSHGTVHNHDPRRPRKLLLHKDEISYLAGRVSQKGYTLVPLRLYIKGRVAKVELALVRGKREYQKKQDLVERAVQREIQRALRREVGR